MSISPVDYNYFVEEILRVNAEIEKVKSDNSIKYALSLPTLEPTDDMISSYTPMIKSGIEGSGAMNDNQPVSITVFVPIGSTTISGTMWNNAALIGVNYVYISYAGSPVGSDNANRYMFWGGKYSIDLPVSNTAITITFQTMDSNGGSYTYNIK